MRVLSPAPIGLSALLLCALTGCPEEKPPPPPGDPGVAKITLCGPDAAMREAGATAYRPVKASTVVRAGGTIRSGGDIAALTFMQNVQVLIGESGKSELILEGPVREKSGTVLMLGLKKGDVRIASYADEPIVLKMPHGEVRGAQVQLRAELERDDRGRYTAFLELNSLHMTVTNAFGSITPAGFCRVRVDEAGPPVKMKDTRPGR